MSYVLVLATEIALIPVTPDGFCEFVTIARERYWRIEREIGPAEPATDLEQSFMTQVGVAAREYGVDGWEDLDVDEYISTGFESAAVHDFLRFQRTLHKIMTRLEINRARERQKAQLTLSDSAKQKIRFHVQQLRERIDASSLPQAKKDRLHKRLDELLVELTGKHLNLAAVMVVLAGAFGLISTVEADLIKLPETIAAISRVLDEAREYRDKLTAPVKKLTFDPKGEGPDDDEIPF